MKRPFDAPRRRRLLRLAALLCAAGIGAGGAFQSLAGPEIPGQEDGSDGPVAGFREIARTEQLTLLYDGGAAAVAVVDNRSGYRWEGGVAPGRYEQDQVNEFWKGNMTSLFTFAYTNLEKSSKAATSSTNAVQEEAKITETALDNGLRLHYIFSRLGIRLAVELTLDRDMLTVRIPGDSVKETKADKLVSVSVLPFLGAASTEEGYMVYPDGSGALRRFAGKAQSGQTALKLDIFGSRVPDLDVRDTETAQGIKTAMLPVFGVRRDGQAFVAVVEDDACESTVEVCPNGLNVGFDRIFNTFTYRRTYSSVKPGLDTDTVTVTKIEEDLVPGDRAVSYVFLPGGGYSEMAVRYREYLLETGGIVPRIGRNDPVPLFLDLLMGVTEKSMLADRFVPMTTFAQARDILEDLTGEGVSALRANLIGWQKDGYGSYPAGFPAAGKLGGDSGLSALCAWAREAGVPLTLQDNRMDVYESCGGFQKRRDCVYTAGGVLLTDRAEDHYLLSPKTALSRFTDGVLPQAGRAGAGGFCFDVFGSLLVADYRKDAPSSRRETRDTFLLFLDRTREALGGCAVTGGNSYVLPYADALHNLPVRDSGYFLTDEAIPFYQMAVHGLLPYTAEEPENLYYDAQLQKLREIEYGCAPYFTLTAASPDEIKYTGYSFLFTSRYGQWKASVVESAAAWNGELSRFYSLTMREHVRLSDTLVRVTYEDGSRIYINYGAETAEADGVPVPARGYAVAGVRG